MSLPETCPFCGSGVFTNFCGQNGWKETWVAYECHTWVFADRDRANNQSNLCISRERARLAARVAELEARCKRLEEAAREVYIDSIASDHPWTELETRNMHALRDVLETNP